MSFTTDIKNEISNIDYSKPELIAELSAIFNIGATIDKNKASIQIENLGMARRIYKLIKNMYNIEINMQKVSTRALRKKSAIILSLEENHIKVLKDLSVINEEEKRMYIPRAFICDEDEEKEAYIRGSFIICGSINDPKTSRYHAEFMINNKKTAEYLNRILNELNYNSKVIKRDKNCMVYIKEAEKISDLLRMLDATNALFYYEDIRIYRDHKNMTNRLNNTEQANIDKIIRTSNNQIELIKNLKEKKDFELLDEKIKEICIYREKYPDTSMDELANIISVETGNLITKSGVNHRFRKIKEMVEKYESN
jgi:DNA-binding protein WhiA